MASSSSAHQGLEKGREEYRLQIAQALKEDDPLAPYERYVKWLLEHEHDSSDYNRYELLEVLEEAVRIFIEDPDFRKDLRYLKLWIAYAQRVEDPTLVYTFLVKQEIGTIYCQLYEEFALCLERTGKTDQAKNVYRLGISKCTRAVDRLKTRHQEFQARVTSRNILPDISRKNSMMNVEQSSSKGAKLYRNPLRNIKARKKSSDAKPARPSVSHPFENSDPYAYVKQSLDVLPGQKKEKYMFDISLLFKDGKEYCIQEARASHLGLLGKKWGPPPPQVPSQNQKTTLLAPMAAEPTVTINTKEALKDVFGMYNSPEKTTTTLLKSGALGTKYAPVKEVEQVNVIQPRNLTRTFNAGATDENAQRPAKSTTFRPFVDEDEKKENATFAPPKFKPFVDENTNSKTTLVTPGLRKGLALKEVSTPLTTKTPVFKAQQGNSGDMENNGDAKLSQEEQVKNIFSRVFTPVAQGEKTALRRPDRSEERPAVFRDAVFRDPAAEQPKGGMLGSGVFSRPPDVLPPSSFQSESVNDAKSTSSSPPSENPREYREPVFHRSFSAHRTPFTPVSRERQVLSTRQGVFCPLEPAQPGEDEEEEVGVDNGEECETELQDEEGQYYEEEQYQTPMGGRLRRFDVMTPIAERTCEYTTSTRAFNTPSDVTGLLLDKGLVYQDTDVVAAAERLAEELQVEEQIDEQDDDVDDVTEDLAEHADLTPEDEPVERTGTLSLVDAISVASSFKPANPCNPSDPQILNVLLSLIPHEPEFHDMRIETSGQINGLQSFASKLRRTSGSSREPDYQLDLAGRCFTVADKLGEGGFGAVFLAREGGGMDSDGEDEVATSYALKVVKPRNIWEYHILRRIHSVLPAELRRSIITPEALYAYRDESYLVLEFCKQGTLLDLVNKAADAGVKQQGACLHELLVMFFAIELMKFVEGMHSAGFIHGDLKIDNCLLRLNDAPGGLAAWSEMYQPSGDGGWKHKGIKIIDFGRTIDTRMFPSGQQFVADWETDVGDCIEMREKRPWTFQPDYFGLAGITYCMLFGKYFDAETVVPVPASEPIRYRISTPLKRYWQADIWTKLFDLLLNPCLVKTDGSLPIVSELSSIRLEMEEWLCNNCNRSSFTLRGLLKKIERSVA